MPKAAEAASKPRVFHVRGGLVVLYFLENREGTGMKGPYRSRENAEEDPYYKQRGVRVKEVLMPPKHGGFDTVD